MCGIAGYWDFHGTLSGNDARMVGAAMSARLTHRGPDGSGVWVDEAAHLILAHQRLSIVDLSHMGHQPMHSSSGNWVIIYNGEIYNATELRHTLMHAGITFQGASDTEVVLNACEYWGVEQAVKKLMG